jgi:hypothetical protein
VLVALAVVAGVVAYLLTRSSYADLPSPSRYWPVTLLLLAVFEGYLAHTTSSRLAGRPGTRPVDPIAVARLAALAKATSPVGAVLTGAYAGFLAHVSQVDGSQASADILTAGLGVAFSLLVVGSALLLERVCRVKPPPEDR